MIFFSFPALKLSTTLSQSRRRVFVCSEECSLVCLKCDSFFWVGLCERHVLASSVCVCGWFGMMGECGPHVAPIQSIDSVFAMKFRLILCVVMWTCKLVQQNVCVSEKWKGSGGVSCIGQVAICPMLTSFADKRNNWRSFVE